MSLSFIRHRRSISQSSVKESGFEKSKEWEVRQSVGEKGAEAITENGD